MKRLYLMMVCIATGLIFATHTSAQTEIDGLMMEKNALCIGPMYGYSSWKNYWEGTLKRNNENLGTVSMSMFSVMGNYGINNKLNVLFAAPYIKTKASAGTMSGMKGIQDLSLWVKWKAYTVRVLGGRLSFIAIGGYSFPLSDYPADFLPLSIGLRSKSLSLRGMVDFQKGSWFGTASAAFIDRANIFIDRTAYYTTEMHYTNEVEMPDVATYNFRAGYRDRGLVAEAIFEMWNTLGGFDITRNNMPFPSNEMDASRVGFNFKYDMPFHRNLSLTGNVMTTVDLKGLGFENRNVGQSTGFNIGVFYVIDLSKKKKDNETPKK
jgi:hypothetical protein